MAKLKKVIALFSGGLDSMLAAALVKDWGVEVIGVCFATPFWETERAEKAAQALGIPLKIINISDQHFEMLKSPPHGFGKNMNPCIDCHALMLKKAKGLIGEKGIKGAKFIVTGEVLGERPFSQNREALSLVAREAGVEGILVRPLSGKLLPPTIPEKKGWIKGEWLLDFAGRQRKKQLELAKKLGIKDFPTPSGGCLLTDPTFSERLKQLFENFEDPQPEDAELLKHGRVFWEDAGCHPESDVSRTKDLGDSSASPQNDRERKVSDKKTLIIVGRNDEENQKLEKLAQKGDLLVEMKEIPGPTALVRGSITSEAKKKAKELVKKYAGKAKGKQVEWKIGEIGGIREEGVDKS